MDWHLIQVGGWFCPELIPISIAWCALLLLHLDTILGHHMFNPLVFHHISLKVPWNQFIFPGGWRYFLVQNTTYVTHPGLDPPSIPPPFLNIIEDEISPNSVDIITVKGWVALILASYHPTYISVQVKPLNVILQQETQSYNDHKDCNILNHILHP